MDDCSTIYPVCTLDVTRGMMIVFHLDTVCSSYIDRTYRRLYFPPRKPTQLFEVS